MALPYSKTIGMYCLGLTGGIATGKSTCVHILKKLQPDVTVFDADESVRGLYARTDVIQIISDLLGDQVVSQDGAIDRDVLRELVFGDVRLKKRLEELIHPLVRQECLALLDQAAKSNASRLFVADIPLLFENGFQFGQSANLLVASTRETQVKRLKIRSGWCDQTVDNVVSSQMPIMKKLLLADVVFWNEGPLHQLENQCVRFLNSLA